ncbi:MAG: hypothetical protein ACRC80_17925 [Waterburya sp.]
MEESFIRHTLATNLQELPAEQIKQAVLKWLDTEEAGLADLARNLRLEQEGIRKQSGLSPIEKADAYRVWAESHRRGLPLLSDEAISRESIYEDE